MQQPPPQTTLGSDVDQQNIYGYPPYATTYGQPLYQPPHQYSTTGMYPTQQPMYADQNLYTTNQQYYYYPPTGQQPYGTMTGQSDYYQTTTNYNLPTSYPETLAPESTGTATTTTMTQDSIDQEQQQQQQQAEAEAEAADNDATPITIPALKSSLNPNAVPFEPRSPKNDMFDILDRVLNTQAGLLGTQPPHSCAYCGISHIESVGQCVQCNKWFCNETGATNASHLLTHLISSHHRGFRPHSKASGADVDLECFFCNSRNVFLLGTINTKEDNVVALVCRSPCLNSPRLKKQGFDISSWTSIIVNKQFVPWILQPCPVEQTGNPITAGLIAQLEELWRTDPQATIVDLYNKVQTISHIQQTPDTFLNSLQYSTIFHELVNIEAEADRAMKSQQCQEGLSIRWATNFVSDSGADEMVTLDTYMNEFSLVDYGASTDPTTSPTPTTKKGQKGTKVPQQSLFGPNRRLFAIFTIFQEEETSLKIVVGDELILTYGDENAIGGKGFWVGTGYAVKASLSGEIVMAIAERSCDNAPWKEEHGFKVQCAWKAVTYDRMHLALTRFGNVTKFIDAEAAVIEETKKKQLIEQRGGVDFTVTPKSLYKDQPIPTAYQKEGRAKKRPIRRGKKDSQNASNPQDSLDDGDEVNEDGKPLNKPCLSLNLYHQLLGITYDDEGIDLPVPAHLDKLPQLPALNQYQNDAILSSLSSTLSLLQGPPGCGKTLTSAYLVYYLHQSLKQRAAEHLKAYGVEKKINPILVCAPSNIAVDHLTEKIHLAGLKVVRVASRSRQALHSSVDFLSLHLLIGQLATRAGKGRFYELYNAVTNNPLSLSAAQRQEYKILLKSVSLAILQNADVICTTCISVGDCSLFGEFEFEHILIDEATQCPEPEILLPMTYGAKQVILIGDHCQLGPVVLSKAAAKVGYNRSLFERLLLRGHVPKMLQIQYRMHPEIATFPANTFYDGNLANGLKSKDRQFPHHIFPFPNQNVPICFIASTGSIEEYSASGTSYINRYEVTVIEKCIVYLLQHGITLGQIGVITPYEGQRLHLMSCLSRESSPLVGVLKQMSTPGANSSQTGTSFEILTALNNLEIASVDSFQGREKDIILFTCVRSNEHSDIGFLSDPRRLNVALTRAKYGMIMTGNPKVLLKSPLWHALLCHFKLQNCFMEGADIEHLRPCSIVIPPSRTFLNARNIRIPVGFDPKTSFGMRNILNYNKQHKQMFQQTQNQSQNQNQNRRYRPNELTPIAPGNDPTDDPTWKNDLFYKTGAEDGSISATTANDGYDDNDKDLDQDIAVMDTIALPTTFGR